MEAAGAEAASRGFCMSLSLGLVLPRMGVGSSAHAATMNPLHLWSHDMQHGTSADSAYLPLGHQIGAVQLRGGMWSLQDKAAGGITRYTQIPAGRGGTRNYWSTFTPEWSGVRPILAVR